VKKEKRERGGVTAIKREAGKREREMGERVRKREGRRG